MDGSGINQLGDHTSLSFLANIATSQQQQLTCPTATATRCSPQNILEMNQQQQVFPASTAIYHVNQQLQQQQQILILHQQQLQQQNNILYLEPGNIAAFSPLSYSDNQQRNICINNANSSNIVAIQSSGNKEQHSDVNVSSNNNSTTSVFKSALISNSGDNFSINNDTNNDMKTNGSCSISSVITGAGQEPILTSTVHTLHSISLPLLVPTPPRSLSIIQQEQQQLMINEQQSSPSNSNSVSHEHFNTAISNIKSNNLVSKQLSRTSNMNSDLENCKTLVSTAVEDSTTIYTTASAPAFPSVVLSNSNNTSGNQPPTTAVDSVPSNDNLDVNLHGSNCFIKSSSICEGKLTLDKNSPEKSSESSSVEVFNTIREALCVANNSSNSDMNTSTNNMYTDETSTHLVGIVLKCC